MSGGGGGGGIGSMLPLALAVGATVATDGAAAPLLESELGATGGAMLGGAAMGAGVGGLSAALTGQDVGRGALMGGLGGGATAGLMSGFGGGAAGAGADAANVGIDAAPVGTPNVANTSALDSYNPGAGGLGNGDFASQPLDYQKAALDPNAWGSEVGTNPANAAKDVNFVPGSTASPAANPATSSSMNPYLKYGALGLGAYALLNDHPTINPAVSPTGSVPKGLQYHFNEDPNAMYQPSVAPNYNGIAGLNTGPTAQRQIGYGYADGGTVEQMSRANATGNNQMFPQSGLGGLTGANTYQNATNTPTPNNVLEPTDAVTDPYTGAMRMATGGIAGYAKGGLGSYSDGGQMLKGPGDGMSDDIPAKIGNHQPARLADGEFVVPADVVSHLGNGSTDAGAKHLYAMMDKVRKARTGRQAQGKQIKPEKYLPA